MLFRYTTRCQEKRSSRAADIQRRLGLSEREPLVHDQRLRRLHVALVTFVTLQLAPELGKSVSYAKAAVNSIMFHGLLGVANIDGVLLDARGRSPLLLGDVLVVAHHGICGVAALDCGVTCAIHRCGVCPAP